MSPRSRRGFAVILIAAAAVLAGCTGVPDSSSPQIVQSVAVRPAEPAVVAPQRGVDPRVIVGGFLANNASSDDRHSGARAFLTPEEKNRWSDAAQTTIVDRETIGNYKDGSVTVTGHQIGELDQSGAYKPTLQSSSFSLTLGLKKVDGQWRIDSLPNGLLIDSSQFVQYYQQQAVYFYDQTEQHLVPDPRYTTLVDPAQLATWLMTQLVGQPSSALSTALPSIPNVNQIRVTLGTTVHVDVPGASQLDSATRDRMAAQIALTLDQASPGIEMTITDGGRPVKIPKIGGDQFTKTEFSSELEPAVRDPGLYYISKGGVVDSNGKKLAGGIGNGQYGLKAVALAQTTTSSKLFVAGTTDSATASRLLVGKTGGPLKATSVSGALSRPAWAPGDDEVWVGDGTRLKRVSATGHASTVPITASVGAVGGRILALRFSPEGARVALVIATGGMSQIWIGSVLRSPGSVQVSGLTAISPQDVTITDVAWNDQLNLFAIGHDKASGDPNVYEVQCDGSSWTPRGIGNLPPGPYSITLAEGAFVAVSAGITVWWQPAGTWVSPSGAAAYGTNPVYVE